ncbi:UNVERIFIED_CONTAM: hypothetical protein FKN15_015014 [Acipenser sinensis]
MQHALGDKTFCSVCAVSQPRTLHRRLTEFNGAVSSASSAEPPPAPSAFKPFAGLQPIELAAAQDLLQGARNSTIATLVRAPPVEGLSKDPACLTGQCRITEAYLKKAYTAEAQVARLANTAGLLTAYLDGVLQSAPLPEPVASELRLVSGQGSGCGQVSLAGHSYLPWPYVRASSGGDPATLPLRAGGVSTGGCDAPILCSRHWPLSVTQMVTRTAPIPTAPHGDLRHCLQASTAANIWGRLQGLDVGPQRNSALGGSFNAPLQPQQPQEGP